MTQIIPYSAELKSVWDSFVSTSKNGVFLFCRDYMEYHSDRFEDYSLLFEREGKIVGLLPANVKQDTLFSHEGLTFGGVLSSCHTKISAIMDVFDVLVEHCKAQGIKRIVYKSIPYIYHRVPANEDLYALFRHNATLMARNVSSCICLQDEIKFNAGRKDNIRKAKNNNLSVEKSADYDSFMRIAEDTLAERHGVKPVHSAEEIKLLASRFPDNIKLFASYKDDRMLAGVVMYESKQVAHVQYASNSREGRTVGAQDIIEDYLINSYSTKKKFFDFGISTENSGKTLNVGLVTRKENFGASSVMYDIYELII